MNEPKSNIVECKSGWCSVFTKELTLEIIFHKWNLEIEKRQRRWQQSWKRRRGHKTKGTTSNITHIKKESRTSRGGDKNDINLFDIFSKNNTIVRSGGRSAFTVTKFELFGVKLVNKHGIWCTYLCMFYVNFCVLLFSFCFASFVMAFIYIFFLISSFCFSSFRAFFIVLNPTDLWDSTTK